MFKRIIYSIIIVDLFYYIFTCLTVRVCVQDHNREEVQG